LCATVWGQLVSGRVERPYRAVRKKEMQCGHLGTVGGGAALATEHLSAIPPAPRAFLGHYLTLPRRDPG